jgi:hypothetical protein
MDLPNPPQAVAAFAAFLRDRLNGVSDTLAPLWNRRDDAQVLSADGVQHPDRTVVATARQLAMVIVGAAAPFAPTSYSRARLIRQMHASGLLTDEHVRRTRQLAALEDDASGAPR